MKDGTPSKHVKSGKEPNMWIGMISAVVYFLHLLKDCGEKMWKWRRKRDEKRLDTVLLVAYKYYEKICVVREIKQCCSKFDIDNGDLLLDAHRLICGHLSNLNQCDHVDLDVSCVADVLGDQVRICIRQIEDSLVQLDALGVSQQNAFSTVASEVGRTASAVIEAWDRFVVISASKLAKSTSDLERIFYDKTNPA